MSGGDRFWIAEKGRRTRRVGAGAGPPVHDRGEAARAIGGTICAAVGDRQRLVQECIRFARQVGYKKIVLWNAK